MRSSRGYRLSTRTIVRYWFWNRRITTILALELAVWGIGSQLFLRTPLAFPLVGTVATVSSAVGQTLFGCVLVTCRAYPIAGLALFFYVVALALGNLHRWAPRRRAESDRRG